MNSSVYWFEQKISQGTALRGNPSSDVIVVGGGMAGLTCAQALSERGVDVIVLEREFCGSGATGRSSGFITPDSELDLSDLVAHYGDARGQQLWEFAKSGLERIRRTIQAFAIDCDYQMEDSLFVARSRAAFRRVIEAEHRTHTRFGYHSTIYDRASLQAILGSRSYQGGISYPGTFGINAYAYCRALRDALERKGVRIFEATTVTRLTNTGVEAAAAAVSARQVAVLTDRDLPALGLAQPAVSSIQTFLSISKPLGDHQVRMIFPHNRLMVWDTDLVYQYFRVTGEGRLLLGGADVRSMYSRHDSRSTARVARKLYAYLGRHFPGLRVEIEHLWPGLIGVTQDFAPVAGRHDALPSVYFAGAGAGLPWAAALGDYLAQKITDGRDELDDVLSPRRSFRIGPQAQHLLGKRAAFALSHGIAKLR